MTHVVRVTLTNAETNLAWPFRDLYVQQMPVGGENLYTRYGVCMGFALDAAVQQRLFRAVHGPYCVVPLHVSANGCGIRQPLSPKARYLHRKVNEYLYSNYAEALAANIPALRVTLYTAAGGRSFCSTCPHAFEQFQGLCTPGMYRCSTALTLSAEDVRGTK